MVKSTPEQLARLAERRVSKYKRLSNRQQEINKDVKRFKKDIRKGGTPNSTDIVSRRNLEKGLRKVSSVATRTAQGVYSRLSVPKDTAAMAKARQSTAKKFASLVGALPQTASGGGAGRPKGTYKDGMPIHIYKKLMTEKKALYEQYKQQQDMQYAVKGYTPEQLQQLQMAEQVQQSQQFERLQQVKQPQRYTQVYTQQVQPQPYQEGPSASQVINQADEDFRFRKFVAEKTIHPNTQRILMDIRNVQNKAQMDNIEMMRRIRERRMVAETTSLLRARNLFGPESNTIDLFDNRQNILAAPNIMLENPNQGNILKTNRIGILDTKSAGNNLFFG